MKKSSVLTVILAVSICAFAQEAIRFQIPTDSTGAPLPVTFPQKTDTIQKLGLAQNLPLNLPALSAKDTASFETYSKRLALVQDSISATYRAIETAKTKSRSLMPKLEPKGEFEKQSEFEARQYKWDVEFAQMQERDAKSFKARLAELEKAKTKIQDNLSSFYSSVDIKSNPSAVSIYIGREEIGATPAEYKLLIPSDVKISLRKEGYVQFDTTIKVSAGAKYKINAVLEEKGIFSQKNEPNFGKILSKDTTVHGYLARIETINARKAEVNDEIKQILANFSNTYPTLEPKKTGETDEQFKKRYEIWTKEGLRQYAELQRKDTLYNQKLNRSIEVLNDYIVAEQSSMISEVAMETKIELGAYDAEKEVFELSAQNIESEKSPFIFKGKVKVPLNTAKTLNRAAPNFTTGVQFINYPFQADYKSVNLAMSNLQLSMAGQSLNVEGSFGEIEQYKFMEGYSAWKPHADSILSGKLKPQGLDYAYAMGKAAVKDVATKSEESGEGMGWRGWTRIFTYALACGGTGMAVLSHLNAEKQKDKISALGSPSQNNYTSWQNEYKKEGKKLEDCETQRLIFGIGAGVFAVAGTATFFF